MRGFTNPWDIETAQEVYLRETINNKQEEIIHLKGACFLS